MASIEQLLEEWQAREADLYRRREAVRRINALRESYGEMPDSAPLVRKDREP